MRGQSGYVLPVFAQRGKHDGNHVQPVKQIASKFFLTHSFLQVPVRRCEKSHIDLDGSRSTHADEFPLLQHAQQLRLQDRR